MQKSAASCRRASFASLRQAAFIDVRKGISVETKFGKFLTTAAFAKLFLLLLTAAVCYIGLRLGNAVEWLFGRQWYLPIFSLLLALLLLLAYAQRAGDGTRMLRCCKWISAYFLCFLLYDVLLLLIDLTSLLLSLRRILRARLILAAAGLTIALLFYGSIHAGRLKTVVYSHSMGNRGERARLVLLSDLHIGLFIGEVYLSRLTAAVNRLSPELVVISGDVFDGCLPSDDNLLHRIAAILRQLEAPVGVYAVLGNHDPAITDPRLRRFFEEANIKLLYNEAAALPRYTLIGRAGIVDMADIRTPLQDLMETADREKPTIILDHDPQGIREAAACGADLVLCGHTHKGQFFPMNLLTKWANGPAYFYGQGLHSRTHSVISAGSGFFQLPIRIGTNSEIVLIEAAW